MNIVTGLLVALGCYLCYKFSTSFNDRMEEKYSQNCYNLWTVVLVICIIASLLYWGTENFWLPFIITIVFGFIAAWSAYSKMLACGATAEEALLGGLSQIAFGIGFAAAIFFVIIMLARFDSRHGRRGRKRR